MAGDGDCRVRGKGGSSTACTLHVDCWIFGGPASQEQDRVLCIHRRALGGAVWCVLRKGRATEVALGAAMNNDDMPFTLFRNESLSYQTV